MVIWGSAIAVSGMTFYTGEIPGTGHLERILLNDK